MSGPVRLERHGEIAVAVIDSPPVNALAAAVRQGLARALDEIEADASVAGLVVAGGPKVFVAGADIREMDAPPIAPILPDLIERLDRLAKPTAAALTGSALGGGLELALACRLRVAAAQAELGFPEVRLGLIPGASGTQRILRHVDGATAARLVATAKLVPAREAEALGLVDLVTETDAVAAAVALLREGIAAGTVPGPTRERPGAALDSAAIEALRPDVARFAKGQSAPGRALDLLGETAALGWEEGLKRERALFLELRDGPESRALRRLFLAERDAGKEALAAAAPAPVATLGVVGAGLMGAGIAHAALAAGLRVVLVEQGAEALERGVGRLRALMDASVASGRIDAARRAAMEEALTPAADIAALAGADLVIEAVFEDLAVKQALLGAVERVVRADCVLASNTSYLDLDAIGAPLADPSRLIGLHFFSPAHVMRLVEVVRGRASRPEAVATGVALAKALRKLPVVTGNGPGFCGNRIFRAYRLIAEAMVEDGAEPAAIDAAMVAYGFPMGPSRCRTWPGCRSPTPTASSSPRAAGRTPGRAGRGAGRGRSARAAAGGGWHGYPEGARAGVPDPEAARVIDGVRQAKGIVPRAPDPGAIAPALVAAIRAEGAAILAEGLVSRPEDVALVMVHGYGFPPHRIGEIV